MRKKSFRGVPERLNFGEYEAKYFGNKDRNYRPLSSY